MLAGTGQQKSGVRPPLISGPDPLGALKEFCEKVRAAYKPRPHLRVS
jgi:hypothetical protein